MALETFNFLDSLVPANPPVSDGLNQGDDHIRGIKLALKNTFPSITGAVTATQAQLNGAANVFTNGTPLLADSGIFFKTNSTDGITNPAAGEVDIKLANAVAARFTSATGVITVTLNGSLTTSGPITAPGMCPIGAVLLWPTDTLPPATEGIFAWCNGAAYSRTTYATCFARLGTLYGTGDGTTTFNVPDYQEVALVGKSGMGGAVSPGRLQSIGSAFKSLLNGVFGSDTTTLGTVNLPPYTPSGSVSLVNSQSDMQAVQYPAHAATPATAVGGNSSGGNLTPLNINATFTGNAQGGTSTPFNNVTPSKVVNWIIRLG